MDEVLDFGRIDLLVLRADQDAGSSDQSHVASRDRSVVLVHVSVKQVHRQVQSLRRQSESKVHIGHPIHKLSSHSLVDVRGSFVQVCVRHMVLLLQLGEVIVHVIHILSGREWVLAVSLINIIDITLVLFASLLLLLLLFGGRSGNVEGGFMVLEDGELRLSLLPLSLLTSGVASVGDITQSSARSASCVLEQRV